MTQHFVRAPTGLIIFTIARYRRLKTITNLFLASLASADLLLVIICVPVNVSYDDHFFVRLFFCLAKVSSYLQYIWPVVSSLIEWNAIPKWSSPSKESALALLCLGLVVRLIQLVLIVKIWEDKQEWNGQAGNGETLNWRWKEQKLKNVWLRYAFAHRARPSLWKIFEVVIYCVL